MSVDDLIFLEPVFVPKVWAGSRLASIYGDRMTGESIGECLGISAHPDGDCIVRDGSLAGLPLSQVWQDHPELFSNVQAEAFPLQVKFIDAGQDLSVQVHPGADWAAAHEGSEPKNECWYSLEASDSGQIVIGHNAATREELGALVADGRWSTLLRSIPMHKGDFFFIPSGTAHCILAGSLIYEAMQPSSTTYRLYDYDRADLDGTKRALHVKEALEVLNVPDRPPAIPPLINPVDGGTETVFVRNAHFCVRKWDADGPADFDSDAPFLLVSAIEGSGSVEGAPVRTGDHFIVTAAAEKVRVNGPLSLMVTSL